jgi:hypothetical protein
MEYSVVIPVGPNDINFFKENWEMSRKNLPPNVFVITKDKIAIDGVTVILEDTFPFKMSDLSKFGNRSGWYLQQLLKLYAPIVLNLDKFVIIDSDTIILKPIQFFEGDIICFNVGVEYHVPYFEHIKKILPLEKQTNRSGICHLMPMIRTIVEDIISRVELVHNKPFWQVMIDNVDPKHYFDSGMSEYELLFNFTLKYHSDKCIIKSLNWKNINNINQITSDLDYASNHWYMRH